MPRKARLTVPDELHHVVLRAADTAFSSEQDCLDFLSDTADGLQENPVRLVSFAIVPTSVAFLAVPHTAAALSSFVQGLGRRWVRPHNIRVGRGGSLWAGRFASAAFSPEWLLPLMRHVEGLPVRLGLVAEPHRYRWSSCAARSLGVPRPVPLADPAGWWALGNTPFERHARYLKYLSEPCSTRETDAIDLATRSGTPMGPAAWLDAMGIPEDRRPSGRGRGRPKKAGHPQAAALP